MCMRLKTGIKARSTELFPSFSPNTRKFYILVLSYLVGQLRIQEFYWVPFSTHVRAISFVFALSPQQCICICFFQVDLCYLSCWARKLYYNLSKSNTYFMTCLNQTLIFMTCLNQTLTLIACLNQALTFIACLNQTLTFITCLNQIFTCIACLNQTFTCIACLNQTLTFMTCLNQTFTL